MDFNEYQEKAARTRVHAYEPSFVYSALGLAGETGEVVEKVKKILRDSNGEVTSERQEELKKEMGDVLWYLSQLAADLDIKFEDVAAANIEKLMVRFEKDKIHGDGDNR